MPTPKKDGVTKKKTVKKTVSKKKVVAQKTSAAVKPTKAKGVFFSWKQWSSLFEQSVTAWRHIIGRYTLILFTTLGLQIVGLVLLSTAMFMLLGGPKGLENIIANLQVGTPPSLFQFIASLVSIFLWFLYAVFIGIISKIAFLSLIKDHLTGKPRGVFSLIFKEGIHLFARYLGLALKVFFYITWPLLLALGVFIAWDLILYFNDNIFENNVLMRDWFPIGLAFVFLGALIYLVLKAVQMLFALPALIHSQQNIAKTFETAKSITKGAWCFTALMWGLFVILLYALNTGLGLIASVDPIILVPAVDPADVLHLTDLLAFFLSLFIFGPITSLFQYLLMLQIAKNQSVKL